MATVLIAPIRMIVGLICGFPLIIRLILCMLLPFLSFITPMIQILFWLIVFIPIWFTDNSLNKGADGQKSFKKAFSYSYLFFHIVAAIAFMFVQMTTCAVNTVIDQSPAGMII